MIDSHQHFWIFNTRDYGWIDDAMSNLRKDFLPVNLKEEQQKIGFEGSVAVQARQSLEETEWLLQLADQNDLIKGVVGWVDLCSPKAEEQLTKYSLHPKFVGVRHVVQDEPDDHFLLRKDFMEGLKLLKRFDLAYDVLIFPRHLPNAVTFVEHFAEQRFVLDHIAKPFIKAGTLSPWKEDIKRLAESKNVYCKVSGMVTEADWKHWTPENIKPYLDVVFEAFGPDRIMIGSDWPVCLVAGTYPAVMRLVIDYIKQFSSSDQNKILGENARKFYKLGVRR